jgi:hypothetical protein
MKVVTFETSVVYNSSEYELFQSISVDIVLGHVNLRKIIRPYSREKLSLCFIEKLRSIWNWSNCYYYSIKWYKLSRIVIYHTASFSSYYVSRTVLMAALICNALLGSAALLHHYDNNQFRRTSRISSLTGSSQSIQKNDHARSFPSFVI